LLSNSLGLSDIIIHQKPCDLKHKTRSPAGRQAGSNLKGSTKYQKTNSKADRNQFVLFSIEKPEDLVADTYFERFEI